MKATKLHCGNCLRYYAQEPSLTDVIQRIAGMCERDYFKQQCTSLSELCYVIISSFMEASRELPSLAPVQLLKLVEAFAFTCSGDFVVYVPEEGRCFEAVSLKTGATLSCVSGFSPLFHIPTQQVGFVFGSGSEESIVLLSDFPISSSLGKYLKIPQLSSIGAPSGVTFTCLLYTSPSPRDA